MTRIAKTAVHAALDQAAKNILDARGDDKVVSRAELKAKLGELKGTEKALTDVFFRFIDNRDHVDGNRVTAADIKKAVVYAREHMINKYDLDNNGLSKDEIGRMSLTGKLAVDLAKQLKGAAPSQGGSAKGTAAELGKLAQGLTYMSESDEPYKAFTVALDKNKPLTGENLAAAAALPKRMKLGESDVKEFWKDGKNPDNASAADIEKFKVLETAFKQLKDVKLFVDTNEDNVRSKVFLVGRDTSGAVVGLQSWRVWT